MRVLLEGLNITKYQISIVCVWILFSEVQRLAESKECSR